MTNLNKFNNFIMQVAENFGFELSREYLKLLINFFQMQNISDIELEAATINLITTMKKDDWNKKFGYGGKPAVADWLEFLGIKKISPDQMAIIELSTVKEIAKNLTTSQAFLFENGVTNAVIEEFGGLRKIQVILLSDLGISFFENNFKKTWVAFYEVKKESANINGYLERHENIRGNQYKPGQCLECFKYFCRDEHKKIINSVTRINNKFATRPVQRISSHFGQPIGRLTSDRSAERSDSSKILN